MDCGAGKSVRVTCDGDPRECGYCCEGRCVFFDRDCCEMREIEGVAVV